MTREERIMKRLQEHYDFVTKQGYEIVCLCLQGSQNYGLDEYSDEYMSDIDSKAIVLPSLDDFINAAAPVSTVLILENNEHAEVKDIRVMFDMFKKENISYIELLYTKYKIVNPKWADLITPLFENRGIISDRNRTLFLNCIAGMAHNKRVALCHPYPNLMTKIEKYGYDGKQLSHCLRLFEFIKKYTQGFPLEDCYKVTAQKELMMNYKKQLDADGSPLSKEKAIELCDFYDNKVEEYKNNFVIDKENNNKEVDKILQAIQYNILRRHLSNQLSSSETSKDFWRV